MAYDYKLIHTQREGSALWATFDNPPTNLIDRFLFRELLAFIREVEADDAILVVVLQSANPDFFLAHFDVEILLRIPIDQPPERRQRNDFLVACERVRTMPKVTIAKIAGRVGGGANELVASCDMRFGALDRAIVNQVEVGLGLMPGGTGTQRLPRLIGRGRALEVILSSDDIDAATAERWGYFNRALAPAQLDAFVDRLARRIASFPRESVATAKQSVLNTEVMPVEDGLWEEEFLFQQLLRLPAARRRINLFLERGGQTLAGGLRVGEIVKEVADADRETLGALAGD